MSKRFTILVSILAVGIILTACASQGPTVQPTPVPSSTQAQATQAESTATTAGYPANSPTDAAQPAATTAGYPAPSEPAPPLVNTGYPAPGTFKLALADGSEKTMAVDTLNTLPKEKVSFDGTDLNVLALVDALKQYGVESYNQVSATGAGGAAITLTKDQVAQAYLDILADGTARLVVQGQPQNTWVAGLISITVN